MNTPNEYAATLTKVQAERLQEASNAIGGISRMMAGLTSGEHARPDWLTDYYDGALIAALCCASGVLDHVSDHVAEQGGNHE